MIFITILLELLSFIVLLNVKLKYKSLMITNQERFINISLRIKELTDF